MKKKTQFLFMLLCNFSLSLLSMINIICCKNWSGGCMLTWIFPGPPLPIFHFFQQPTFPSKKVCLPYWIVRLANRSMSLRLRLLRFREMALLLTFDTYDQTNKMKDESKTKTKTNTMTMTVTNTLTKTNTRLMREM